MRTSVDIPEPLMKRAKKIAQQRGTTLRALILEGLRVVAGQSGSKPPYQLPDRSFGEGGLAPGLSWEDAEAMDDLAYGDRR